MRYTDLKFEIMRACLYLIDTLSWGIVEKNLDQCISNFVPEINDFFLIKMQEISNKKIEIRE